VAKQMITVELDDETVRSLAKLGDPIEALVALAQSTGDGMRHPNQSKRAQTDESLRVERDKSDAAIANQGVASEDRADEVVRIARQRADQLLQATRDGGEGGRSADARSVLEDERSTADVALKNERAAQKSDQTKLLVVGRDATDKDLVDERAHVDTMIVDQREANAQMVRATIRAQELSAEADVAKKRAEESERKLLAVAEFREMFIGVLGHDLRNPLGSIGMAAALLLRRGKLDEQDSKTVARIIRSNQRMSRMITQLLDLTRARLGGGLPIEPQPTDLSEVCRDVIEEFEATIVLKVEGDVTGIWDRDRLAEVLSNLAGNAIEYAAPGTVVMVKAYADGAEVVVEVTNHGNPIPAEELLFIFEPFRRAKQHEKSASGNLGLGLYIAKQIVASHGGTLDAHSADGRTIFAVRLPRCPPPPVSIQSVVIDGAAKA